MGRLAGKVAFVAGGTSGIGQATAAMFAAEGARVAITGRRAIEGEAVAKAILEAGGEAIFVQMDVGEADQVERAVRATVDRFGRLDILFANAGGSSAADGPVTTVPIEEFWRTTRVNLFGTLLCSRFAIPEMIRGGGGSVINMASITGFGTTQGRDAYSAAKAGVMALTRSTAREYVADGVRVNAIAPAAVRTERILAMIQVVPEAQAIVDAQALGLIDPREIGHAAVFLASDESRTLTGQVIAINGGAFEG
jgi:NAD(P)-dependent dehydrogenase (short-subunit alcohol dehydrogenase family)